MWEPLRSSSPRGPLARLYVTQCYTAPRLSRACAPPNGVIQGPMALRQLVAVTAVLLAAAHTAAAQTPPAGCTLQLGSQALAFTKCLPIAGVGDNFVLYWNLTGPSSAVWGMSTTSTGGYGERP